MLIPTAQVSHVHHRPSSDLWNFLVQKETAASTHSLAETYATLTDMPMAFRISSAEALSAIEIFLKRLTPIALTPNEYLEALRGTSKLGHSGGMIYDALHLACARKVEAEQIYTWNVKHFRAVAPDLADRIVTP